MRPDAAGPPRPRWDATAQRVLEHPGGLLRVLGGPGTGKTTLVAELVADRVLGQHADPENVLVLTSSRRAATALRTRISRLLSAPIPDGSLRTARTPLVRTVHSYAFGVLRAQAVLHGEPPPRLLSGPDADAVVRELLAGDMESGASYWPAKLRPALRLPGFAAELRDLLLRAAERGVGPEDLTELGHRHDREEWVAAGRFGEQYEQVTLLHGGGAGNGAALDAAELVASALGAFDTDDELYATERARVRHLFVDDAQHLDPQAFELVARLGEASAECVLFGDPDQTVFSFRGADPTLLTDVDPDGDRTVVLTVDHRMTPAVAAAVRRLTERLPGAGPHRAPTRSARAGQDDADEDGDGRDGAGRVTVRRFASAAQEAGWVADQLRRAHLLDGVPWPEMAVVVRSAQRSLPVLRRALLAAGVPLAVPAETLPLAQHPVVRPFLDLLRVADGRIPLDEDTVAALLSGSLGGADTLAIRRLRRGLRRLELAAGGARSSGELLIEAVRSGDALAALDNAARGPVRRIADLLKLATDLVAAGQGVEQVLWRLWRAGGLERRLVERSARGGPMGAQADRDLDAVLLLFDAAARYADRLPGSGVGGFAEHLAAQRIVGDSLAPSAPVGEAVSLLTAHSAIGREWTVVAVPGVQEGVWPDLRTRGSLLGVEKLVDLVSGIGPDAVGGALSATAPLLAEERRLLRLAASRARRVLLVSAVRGEDEQPSRFLDELDDAAEETNESGGPTPIRPAERALNLADLVGELRRVACDPDADRARRPRAAGQLARLAAARVPGAHPHSWYGLPDVSTEDPLWTEEDEVPVSPSTVETLTTCPLRWMVERHGGTDPSTLPAITGSLVHALAQAAAEGADAEALREALDRAWAEVDAGAPWFSRRERARVERMVAAFRSWLVSSRDELTQAAVEHALDVQPERRPGGPWLRVRGRVDRLETDAQGRPVVVDIKTSKAGLPSKQSAETHPQLATYQLAAALGAFEELGVAGPPGGARLLYVAPEHRQGEAAERVQPPLSEEAVGEWLEVVRDAAQACVGPSYRATENAECLRCPARSSCPLHDAGRQVSH